MNSQRITLIIVASLFIAAPVWAQMDLAPEDPTTSQPTFATEEARWEAFTTNVRAALTSDHGGLKQGALQQIIRHGSNLETTRSDAYEVMRIYRNHENDDVRRMAVVALGQMQDAWAIGFLARSAQFEGTPRVRHTIKAVVAQYRSGEQEQSESTPAPQIAQGVK